MPKALNRNNPSMFLQKIWVVAGSRAILTFGAPEVYDHRPSGAEASGYGEEIGFQEKTHMY